MVFPLSLRFLSLFLLLCAGSFAFEANSPDGSLQLRVGTSEEGRLSYSLRAGQVEILEESDLGVTLGQHDLGMDGEILSIETSTLDESYPSFWNHSVARNHCNVVTAQMQHRPSGQKFQMEFRVYDDGLAFRTIVPGDGERVFFKEATSWNFPDRVQVWHQGDTVNYEGNFYLRDIAKMSKNQSIAMPITLVLPNDAGFAAVTEGSLFRFSGANLKKAGDGSSEYFTEFEDNPRGWVIDGEVRTPWRIVVFSPDLDGLFNTDIVLNTNEKPGALFDDTADWIKPGRSLWSWLNGGRESVNPTTMRHYVDVAETLGWEYILVDEGWEESPPVWSHKPGWGKTKAQSLGELKQLVEYADGKNVKVWVWKHFHLLQSRNYRRSFFENLQKIGVVGIKVDFIDSESAAMIDFYENCLKDAAEFKLMVNFHGSNKPTGESRTYPNEVARESVKGLEYRHLNADHNATLPFTRLIAGHADYTPMHFNKAWMANTSTAHQVACGLIYTTPVLFFAANPDDVLASPALDLIKQIPATWDETYVLPQSEIGKLAGFARRKGDQWFIAILNGRNRDFSMDLKLQDFLKTSGHLTGYSDAKNDRLAMTRSERAVSPSDVIKIQMEPNGGYAAIISVP